MESYILSDEEDWNKAEVYLANIIICKKINNGLVDFTIYRYFKMRGDMSTIGDVRWTKNCNGEMLLIDSTIKLQIPWL